MTYYVTIIGTVTNTIKVEASSPGEAARLASKIFDVEYDPRDSSQYDHTVMDVADNNPVDLAPQDWQKG